MQKLINKDIAESETIILKERKQENDQKNIRVDKYKISLHL